MKKYLLTIVALIATICLRAQAVSDTTKIVLQEPTVDLVQTVADINNDLRLHAQLVTTSMALEGAGALLFYYASKEDNDKRREAFQTYGTISCVAGGILFVCSYIPIWRKELKVDERGLVLSIPISK